MAERLAFVLHGVEGTEELGERLGELLGPGAVVALGGELGAGKTAFVRGLARGLGVEEGVSSPTFTLMQEHLGRVPFFHFDAWMTGREEAFLEGGGADYLAADGVAAIEWADRVEGHLPRPRLAVRLAHRTLASRSAEVEVVAADSSVAAGATGTSAADLELALREALSALAGAGWSDAVEQLSPSPIEPRGARDVPPDVTTV